MSYSIASQSTPLTVVATVNATLGNGDTLLWDYEFVPPLQTYSSSNQPVVSPGNDASGYLHPGLLRFTALAGVDATSPFKVIPTYCKI